MLPDREVKFSFSNSRQYDTMQEIFDFLPKNPPVGQHVPGILLRRVLIFMYRAGNFNVDSKKIDRKADLSCRYLPNPSPPTARSH